MGTKAVLSTKYPEIQLRTELVESVAAGIVRRRDPEVVTSDCNHFHAVLDRDWEIEDMFQCATVDNRREPAVEVRIDWKIEIMDVSRLFIRRRVE